MTAYRRTAAFTEASIPAALTRDHATRDGVWARVIVLAGQLRFVDQAEGGERILPPGTHEVIFPARPHRVEPMGPVRFVVEFCRLDTQPGPDPGGPMPHRPA